MPQTPELVALPADERESAPPVAASLDNPVYVPSPVVKERELSHGEKQLQEFLSQVRLASQPAPEPPPPPPPTPKIQARINEEQEAGRRSVARHAALQAQRPQPVPDKSEGTTTPVFRPEDYVPGLFSKTDTQRGVKNL